MLNIIRNLDFEIKNKFLEYIHKDGLYISNKQGVSRSNYHTNSYDDEMVNLYKKYLYPVLKNVLNYEFKMNCIWYHVYSKNSNSYYDFHTHVDKDCHLCAVYYLKMKSKDISTQFLIDGQKIRLDVMEGDLVLFDARIPHASPPNNTDTDKIIVSFKLDCR